MSLRHGPQRQRRPGKVEEGWRDIGLHAFLEFANGDLRGIEPRRLRSLLSQVAAATLHGGGAIRPPVELPKWLLQRKPRPTGYRGTPVAPPTTRREALALQATLRDDLLARIFPEAAPEPVTDPVNNVGQTDMWRLPATITRVDLYWPAPRVAGRPGTHIDLAFSNGTFRIPTPIYHTYTAAWPDLFWLGIMTILEQNGARIRRCNKCGKLFAMRTRRQEYCTGACSLRGRQLKWIEAHQEEIKERRAAAYRKKLRDKFGPNVRTQARGNRSG